MLTRFFKTLNAFRYRKTAEKLVIEHVFSCAAAQPNLDPVFVDDVIRSIDKVQNYISGPVAAGKIDSVETDIIVKFTYGLRRKYRNMIADDTIDRIQKFAEKEKLRKC